jgi:hypothetical protein
VHQSKPITDPTNVYNYGSDTLNDVMSTISDSIYNDTAYFDSIANSNPNTTPILINPKGTDTLFFKVDGDTLYRQYPDTIRDGSEIVCNNWLSSGVTIEILNNKTLSAPDPKKFKYKQQVK